MKNKTDRPGLRERVPGFKVWGNDDRIAMVQNAVVVSGHIDLCWNHFYSGRKESESADWSVELLQDI